MYQKVIIVGNLGSDPVMRYTADGTPVTSFNVATNERWGDRSSGEKRERTTWWRVTAWRKQAEVCNEYLTKGSRVLVEGTITVDPETGRPRLWTGQDGQVRSSLELTLRSFEFMSGRGESAGGGMADEAGDMPSSEDDLPF